MNITRLEMVAYGVVLILTARKKVGVFCAVMKAAANT